MISSLKSNRMKANVTVWHNSVQYACVIISHPASAFSQAQLLFWGVDERDRGQGSMVIFSVEVIGSWMENRPQES